MALLSHLGHLEKHFTALKAVQGVCMVKHESFGGDVLPEASHGHLALGVLLVLPDAFHRQEADLAVVGPCVGIPLNSQVRELYLLHR